MDLPGIGNFQSFVATLTQKATGGQIHLLVAFGMTQDGFKLRLHGKWARFIRSFDKNLTRLGNIFPSFMKFPVITVDKVRFTAHAANL